MVIMSKAFENGESIPKMYSKLGDNISPPLKFKHIPEETESLVLICDDPDAPNRVWTHWIVFNIDPSISIIPKNTPKTLNILNGLACQGINDFGNTGYDGPIPPSGEHRYYFKLYALNKILRKDRYNKVMLLDSMKDYVIEKTKFYGTFKKG